MLFLTFYCLSLLCCVCAGTLKPSMILESCNNVDVLGLHFKKIMSMLKSAPRPIVLRFRHDPDVTVTFNKPGPLGLRLAMFDDVAIVTGFVTRPGPAEKSQLVHPGHVLHCVAGRPVTTTSSAGSLTKDLKYVENIDALRRASRPIILRFGPNTATMDMAGESGGSSGGGSTSSGSSGSSGSSRGASSQEDGSSPSKTTKKVETPDLGWCDVSFNEGPLGITFCEFNDGRTGILKLPKLDGLAKTKVRRCSWLMNVLLCVD